jgi:hypothetical protein
VAEQEKRMPAVERAAVQAPRRREVEPLGRIADFEKDGRDSLQRGGLLRDPQGIEEFFRLGDQKATGIYPMQESYARRIGIACFPEALRHADPQEGCGPLLDRKAREGQDESCCRTRVTRGGRIDFRQARAGKSAAEGCVEAFGSRGQQVLPQVSLAAAQLDVILRPCEFLGGAAFDTCDLMAQGGNGFPRHGRRGHDGSSSNVLVMF